MTQYSQGIAAHSQSASLSSRRWIESIGLAIALGIAYFLAARLSLFLILPDGVAVFWPAAGVSAGVLIGLGPQARLPVVAGTMVATAVANLLGDRNIWSTIVFALCNAAEPVLVSMDLQFAERLGKAFEAKYPGIAVRVERSGAERVFTRIAQEYSSDIHSVDVVNTSDQAHCIIWKRNGWLAPYLPEEVVKHYDKHYYDPEALNVVTRILISPIAYNTNLVKKEDAPKSFKDLLDPKWKGKLVKAHPAYSGTIMQAGRSTISSR